MKHRTRIDLSFDNEADAKALMEFAKTLVEKAVSINEGKDSAEISFCEREYCYHDEVQTRPCELQERVEVKKAEIIGEIANDSSR